MVVNRGNYTSRANIWTTDTNRTFVDLMTGYKIQQSPQKQYHFGIEANGFAAILAVDEVDEELDTLLEEMRNMSNAGPLSSFDNEWKFLTQEL